ncbi:MAG: GNAT family N-acetyltransferase [Halopenitus sp.]
MEIRELTTAAERREAVPILRQLWDDRDPEDVLEWTTQDDYHLFGAVVDDELVGVAGALVTHLLHHERHAWLYDLVVDEPRRGDGVGVALVEFVEDWAAEHGCERVALASPEAKDGVHQFYDQQEYEKWGYVIEKPL